MVQDRPEEACGVFGVEGTLESWTMTYYGLYALQHRGQESAGIAIVHNDDIVVQKGMGLVSDVFDPKTFSPLPGHLAIGHVRYSTTGDSSLENAQPLLIRSHRGVFAIAHNGNLTNYPQLRLELEREGAIFQSTSDTEVVAHLIVRSRAATFEEAVAEAMHRIEGGYAIVILTSDRVIGIRDPHGIRPMVLGGLGKTHALVSESCALDTVGLPHERDVLPGEMVVLQAGTVHSQRVLVNAQEAFCTFEYIYFARPDSDFQGLNVHNVRKTLGAKLAEEAPADADVVIGVPDSSLAAASGYAEALNLPYETGLIKNRYIGRTFIQPTQQKRAQAVRLKLNAIKKVVGGKRVALIDDSIVRGTTSQHIVSMLREAGATEVHLRITSPPYRHACHYGIDTSAEADLIANGRTPEEIARLLGANSLAYLSEEGLRSCLGDSAQKQCMACFSGKYPVPIGGGSIVEAL